MASIELPVWFSASLFTEIALIRVGRVSKFLGLTFLGTKCSIVSFLLALLLSSTDCFWSGFFVKAMSETSFITWVYGNIYRLFFHDAFLSSSAGPVPLLRSDRF